MARASQTRPGRRAPDKKQAILRAASRLFAERGFERTTTKLIAREAGVAEGTIFLYFPTKRDILIALLEKLVLQSLKHTLIEVEGMSDRDVVYNIILGRLRLWGEHSGILRAIIAQVVFDRSLAQVFLTRITGPAMDAMIGFITRRQRDGAFPRLDPQSAIPAVLCQVIGLGIMNSVAPDVFDLATRTEDYASRMTDMLLGEARI